MNLLNDFKKMKVYAIICAIGYVCYVCASISGYRILGDDKEEQIQPGSARAGTHSFYHK